jgi:hypothetical protein
MVLGNDADGISITSMNSDGSGGGLLSSMSTLTLAVIGGIILWVMSRG